jgi:hypothetical protein
LPKPICWGYLTRHGDDSFLPVGCGLRKPILGVITIPFLRPVYIESEALPHTTPVRRLASLGVHEHWNDPKAKKYSRNLGSGKGIELVAVELGRATTVR